MHQLYALPTLPTSKIATPHLHKDILLASAASANTKEFYIYNFYLFILPHQWYCFVYSLMLPYMHGI